MRSSIELFRQLCSKLDAVVIEAGDLVLADDIHPAVRAVGAYASEEVELPKKLAALRQERPVLQARLGEARGRLRRALHAGRVLTDATNKLRDSLAHNEEAAKSEAETPAAPVASYALAIALPTSRRARIAELRAEISAKEAEAKDRRREIKNAKDALRRADKRVKEIAEAIETNERLLKEHVAGLDGIVKILRKTIRHLVNRMDARERKRARHSVPAVTDAASAAPTDEDIRALAESNGLPAVTTEDLEAARQLFCR